MYLEMNGEEYLMYKTRLFNFDEAKDAFYNLAEERKDAA